MNNKIIDLFKDDLLELCWVENFLGPIRVITSKSLSGKKIDIPATCQFTSADCVDKEKDYTDIRFNENDKSIIWVDSGSFSIGVQPSNPAFAPRSFNANMKLFIWVNLAKLGREKCEQIELLIPDLLKLLDGKKESADNLLKNVYFQIEKTTTQDARYLNQFDFANKWRLYPYDYMTIDIAVSGHIDLSCSESFECKPEIKC